MADKKGNEIHYRLKLGNTVHRQGRIIIAGSHGFLGNYTDPSQALDFLEHEISVNSLKPECVTIDDLLKILPVVGSTKKARYFEDEVKKLFVKYDSKTLTEARA